MKKFLVVLGVIAIGVVLIAGGVAAGVALARGQWGNRAVGAA